MTRTAKAGDMALVVGCRRDEWIRTNPNGLVVKVLTDPKPAKGPVFPIGVLVSRIDIPDYLGKEPGGIRTACLIPLPPDSEARTLFASESDRREVKA